MQWIKAHLNLVITIAVGVLGITGLVLGIFMSDVASAMQQDQATLSSLSGAKGSNAQAIEDARKHTAQVKDQLDKSLKDFESIGLHTPILDKVFPSLPPKDTATAFKFPPEYQKALEALVAKLHGIKPPSSEDYKHEEELIQSEKTRREREEKIGRDPTSRPAGAGRAAVRPTQPLAPQINKPPDKMTLEELAQTNSPVRAAIRRARQGYCYASLDDKATNTPSSFMMPELLTSRTAPTLEQMWYAQMVLWVETDVVNALAAINDEAAAKLPEQDRWVGHLPVKRLVKITVGNYMTATPAQQSAAPNMPGGASFTNSKRTEYWDVIPFTVDLYLNPLYLPPVLTRITEQGFYTTTLVNYEAEPPTTLIKDYVLGAQPVVHAILQFEGCYLRSQYEKMMPETVKGEVERGQGGLAVSGGPGMAPGGMRPGMPTGLGPGFGPGVGPGMEDRNR